MLGFIDCGILAKEIMMLFPEEDNITPDIYSAIKSLSLIILGTDSNPSTSSQKNFCRTLRNIVEELFKLQHGESEDIIDADSLRKLEDLAQQAINWRVNFNNKNPCQTAPTVEDHACQSDDIPGSSKETATDMPYRLATRPDHVDLEHKLLICIHTMCWGASYTTTRFRSLLPTSSISRSGVTLWIKRLPLWLDQHRALAKKAVEKFDRVHANDIPLRYVYEIRQKLLHKRNTLNCRIGKYDIPVVVREVLSAHGVRDKYEHCLGDEDFCERVFHASSKINFDRKSGCTGDFFTAHPTWFLD